MKKLTKSTAVKYAAGFVGVAVAFAMVVTPVFADTASNLQATINSLMAQIQAAQAQLTALNGGTTTTTTTTTGYTFNTNLTVGSTGADVLNLQKVLNMSADTQVAATGAGSPGNESSYFGGLTKAAVMKFQTKYGISPVAGYVGALTRAKLNSMAGTGGTTTTTTTGTLPAGCTSSIGYSSTTGQPCSSGGTTVLPTGGNLTVMAGVQPANSLAPQGANRVPFTTITLTAGSADITVNSITVQRSGLAQDAVFSGIVLLDPNGMQIGIAKTLNSNHQAMVGDPFVIKAGTSETLTIAGNMATPLTNYAGQVAELDVVAINTSATVAGSLPITGAQQTINASLTLGSAQINTSSFDPAGGSTQPIGTTGYRFSGFKITAGSAEDLTLKSIRWNQTGSVGSSDLANVVTVVNGTSYPTTISVDGKYYSTVFPSGIVIAKGNSVDIYIQGDIVGSSAAGRTSEFDVYKNTDLYLVGNTYGYGVTAPTGSGVVTTASAHGTVLNTSSNPWFEGSQLTVTAGSVTLIGKANEVTAQNIAINVPNQVLGGFATNFSGEPVSAQSMYFEISTSSTLGTTVNSPYSAITSISLVDENGAVVAGPVDAALGDGASHGGVVVPSTSYALVHFTDTVTFPTGRHVYHLQGKIPTGWANGTTVNVFTQPKVDWQNVTGQTTGNSVDLSGQSTTFSMNQMTVKGASLTVNVSAQPSSQFVVGGVQNFVLANYQLDASQSGEDLRLSGFPVSITATGQIADLTGCQLYNGTTALNTGSRVKNTLTNTTAQNFSFDNSLTVPKGTLVTLSLECNIASNPTQGTYVVNADTNTPDYSITGVTSGTTVIPIPSGTGGGTMTVGNGSFTEAVDSSTPSLTTVAAGSTGVTMGVIKFRATNESVNLTKIGLTNTAGSASDLGQVYLYSGSTLIGTVTFPQGANQVATSTLYSPLVLTSGVDTLVTIKADMSAIGTGQSGTEGNLVKIDPINAEGSGQSSGSTLKSYSTPGVNGVRTFKSFPTVAVDTTSLSTTGVAGGELMRFKISANPSGPVGIYQLAFTLSTSSFATGGGVTNVKLYAFNDSAYSSPVTTVDGSGLFGNTGVTPSLPATALVYTAHTNPLEIPAGSTYYFDLEGSVAGVTTGTSVTTKLLGDANYITPAHLGAYQVSTSTGAVADGDYFIWSGNATSTAVFSSNDWANGSNILGLPSGGVTFTRSQ
jgi:hypothetical protein